ncbi:hypothetical protein MATL_G00227160 [Megalops atlanticus]|uniref:Uncharacterized protein n=1 Tax=Megalops atlanticus TaxID=7932 RepID=A0A9D3PCU1_MEGAT|nr:hypothetical protein MATL_G00227160 [Megalops atlanticus]
MEGMAAQSDSDEVDFILCGVCNVKVRSGTIYKIHLTTHQHIKKAEALIAAGKAQREQVLPVWTSLTQYLDYLQLDEPIIGLKHLVEVQGRPQGAFDPPGTARLRYLCRLCFCEADMPDMVSHIVGRKHRQKYLETQRPDLVTWDLNNMAQLGKVIRAKAEVAERQEGRGVPEESKRRAKGRQGPLQAPAAAVTSSTQIHRKVPLSHPPDGLFPQDRGVGRGGQSWLSREGGHLRKDLRRRSCADEDPPGRGYPTEDPPGRGYATEDPPGRGYATEDPHGRGYATEDPHGRGYATEHPPGRGYAMEDHPQRGYVREDNPGWGYVREDPPGWGYTREDPPGRGYVREDPPGQGYVREEPHRQGFPEGKAFSAGQDWRTGSAESRSLERRGGVRREYPHHPPASVFAVGGDRGACPDTAERDVVHQRGREENRMGEVYEEGRRGGVYEEEMRGEDYDEGRRGGVYDEGRRGGVYEGRGGGVYEDRGGGVFGWGEQGRGERSRDSADGEEPGRSFLGRGEVQQRATEGASSLQELPETFRRFLSGPSDKQGSSNTARMNRFSEETGPDGHLTPNRDVGWIPTKRLKLDSRGPEKEDHPAQDSGMGTERSDVLDVLKNIDIESVEEANFIKDKLCKLLKEFQATKSEKQEPVRRKPAVISKDYNHLSAHHGNTTETHGSGHQHNRNLRESQDRYEENLRFSQDRYEENPRYSQDCSRRNSKESRGYYGDNQGDDHYRGGSQDRYEGHSRGSQGCFGEYGLDPGVTRRGCHEHIFGKAVRQPEADPPQPNAHPYPQSFTHPEEAWSQEANQERPFTPQLHTPSVPPEQGYERRRHGNAGSSATLDKITSTLLQLVARREPL